MKLTKKQIKEIVENHGVVWDYGGGCETYMIPDESIQGLVEGVEEQVIINIGEQILERLGLA